ncbi:MAG: histidine ammonia-lyase [Saprospiraceae bacterium]|nr:histidine ammonia-lyase [Saprospiraceae bacterium]
MDQFVEISEHPVSLAQIREIIDQDLKLVIAPSQILHIQTQRKRLEDLIHDGNKAYYGVNTGFGALCNVVIAPDQLDDLQANLIRSHACGFGENVPDAVVKICLLLKIICLSKGYSAVRPELIAFLIELYNRKLYPQIPSMGSLGASGDLAPLAHLFLPCIGEGRFMIAGQSKEVQDLLLEQGLIAPQLKAKEGLALLNGTQYSLALLIHNLMTGEKLFEIANLTAALSCEAFNCSTRFLLPEIHILRNQNGQIVAAQKISSWIDKSDLEKRSGKSVQDPYSFRCAPQVHGACLDVLNFVKQTAEKEINAITDNPILLSSGEIVSGGNFHAEVLAFASDNLSLALCELANISERRLYQLVCGSRGLPDFLTNNPGLNSGYMIVQYAAAAAVSMNKQLATPSSVDSIISSKGQEDHVSMAANSGLRSQQILKNASMVLTMEWMTASRAMHFRKDYFLDPKMDKILNQYLQLFPIQESDHVPAIQYESSWSFLSNLF